MSYPPQPPHHGQPYGQQYPSSVSGLPTLIGWPAPLPPPRKRRWPIWVVAGVLGVLGLCGAVVGLVNLVGDKPAGTSTKPTSERFIPVTPTEPTEPEPEPVVTTTPPKPKTFEKLSEREWKKIAKDPDAHIGEALIIYGSVTQFDSATGTGTFRANVGATDQEYDFDYDTNTVLTGDASVLEDVVEDDEFRANVVVTGSLSYETTLGGELTVPQLEVVSIRSQ